MLIRYTKEAQADLIALPLTIKGRIARLVERLERWPEVSGAKPLRGNLAGRYRMRTGDYRVQFYVVGDELIVEKIGHRDGFYED